MIVTVLMIVFLCVPSLLHAQPDPGCDPDDPLCPIDGGVSFLLAAGVAYGIKKVKDFRKEKNTEQVTE